MRQRARYKQVILTGLIILSGLGVSLFATPSYVSAGSPEDTDSVKEVPVCQAGDACDSFLTNYINPFVILLSVLVGVIAAISIVVAGIQYAMSADDPGKVTAAKTRILNTVIGLVAYIFLFAFLNYIVPGGLV